MSETPSQLDAFLSSGTPPEASPPTSPDGGKAPATPEAPKPTPQAAPTKAATPAAAEPDDDAEPADPEPGQPIVPRTAYEKERQRRQNWVERAGRAEAERDALAKQLEEAKKPSAPAADPPRFEPIDPARDPVGYTRRVQGVMLNERLNTSEMMAVDKHGKEKIDAETAYFQQRAKTDPALFQKLYSTPHPYQWMIDDNATARLHEEIGTDPAAYEARLRAKWGVREGRRSAAGLAGRGDAAEPGERTERGAAGTNGFAGPPSLADILTRPERKR